MAFELKKQLKTSVAFIALASGLALPSFATAEAVTLRSTDGTINVTGDFIDYSDDTYIIQTALGQLRIAAGNMVCEGDACPNFDSISADVRITGSGEIGQGMMPLLMTGFAGSLGADAQITNPSEGETVATLVGDDGFGDEIGSYLVSSTNDADAFESLLDGSATLGISARRITVDEARALRADGAGNMVSPAQEHIIAVDSMIVVTHPSNPVNQLTKEQLAAIFAGEITNWSEVGGLDRPINVITREEGSTSYDYFMSYLYGDARPDFRPQGIAADDQVLSNVMFHDRNAIGYLGYAFQRGAKPVSLVNECGIANIPDAFSAKTEEYNLSRRMYLYNRTDNLDEPTQAFIDFAASTEADAVIGKSGFIDLGILRRAQGADDPRRAALNAEIARYDVGFEGEIMADMLSTMDDFDRLSTTFRFRTGSSRIDERGHLDMMRLVQYLSRAPEGTSLKFVGFTDDVGAFDANQRLAEQRANIIMDDFREMSGDRFANIVASSVGYGEVAPSACNVSDRGRGINRRVEVWIKSPAES